MCLVAGPRPSEADAPAMAAAMARPVLTALALLCLATPAAAVEVCKVVDLQLVTQTGEFFLAGAPPPPRPAAEVEGGSGGRVLCPADGRRACPRPRCRRCSACYAGAEAGFGVLPRWRWRHRERCGQCRAV